MYKAASTPLRRRTVTALAATAATVAFLLAGCSGTSGSDAKTTITLSMQQTDVKKGDPTTWAIVQAFEKKYPNITVTVTGQPVAQHNQAIDVAAQSNTLPTVFWLFSADTGKKLTKAGALLDLGPILKDEGLTSKFNTTVLNSFKEGSTQFGVPYQALLTGFYVNKKILSDNGLKQPVTWDDLVNVAKVLSGKGITTISNGASQSSFSVWAFLTCLDRFGYDDVIQDILSGKASYDNPDFLKFYQALAELQKAGAFSSNVATQTYDQAVSDFANGKAAFLDSGVWASGQLQSSPVGADTGFWVGPQFSNGVGEQNIVMNVVGAPLAVSAQVKKGSAEYKAVEKFIGFYYSDAGQQIFADNGQPPVTTVSPKVAATNTVFQSVLDAAKGLAVPLAQPDQYLSTASQNVMYDSIYGVIEGQLTPEAAVDMVQKAIAANK
ncbi:MAG TPA: extracellular solute-binding protein [Galbitalea sp.]|jgi:raffinose/stachyose/melibiose transport system substrate-binding protein